MQIIIRERPTLCEGCHHGHVAQRASGEVLAICTSLNKRMPADLRSCSRYHPIAAGYMGTGVVGNVMNGLLIDPRERPPSADKGYV